MAETVVITCDVLVDGVVCRREADNCIIWHGEESYRVDLFAQHAEPLWVAERTVGQRAAHLLSGSPMHFLRNSLACHAAVGHGHHVARGYSLPRNSHSIAASRVALRAVCHCVADERESTSDQMVIDRMIIRGRSLADVSILRFSVVESDGFLAPIPTANHIPGSRQISERARACGGRPAFPRDGVGASDAREPFAQSPLLGHLARHAAVEIHEAMNLDVGCVVGVLAALGIIGLGAGTTGAGGDSRCTTLHLLLPIAQRQYR